MVLLESLPDGVYGLIAEPVFDANDPGTSAIVRVLVDGESILSLPLGPQYLTAKRSELWVVATLNVASDVVTLTPLGDVLSLGVVPTTPPSEWPVYE